MIEQTVLRRKWIMQVNRDWKNFELSIIDRRKIKLSSCKKCQCKLSLALLWSNYLWRQTVVIWLLLVTDWTLRKEIWNWAGNFLVIYLQPKYLLSVLHLKTIFSCIFQLQPFFSFYFGSKVHWMYLLMHTVCRATGITRLAAHSTLCWMEANPLYLNCCLFHYLKIW